ncbi:MAG: undecaprenyl/decaprenyl-phosphate alpha-N-acetylglucosaminyl 1-phosphate transferase [Bacteroidales bacterium]|nr:undecaprenyl/decaprenyl-phosphate alpha-N-acetylglucosaminyl 1-phosphate transferase [Candidatus Sodaliphilus limicaballi]
MPGVIKYALNRGMYDKPNERKIHDEIVPRIGGVVFLVASLLSMLAGGLMMYCNDLTTNGVVMQDVALQLCAVCIIFAVGLIDDIKGLKYRVKFVAQFLTGVLLCASGVYLKDFHGMCGLHEIHPAIGWLITIFAVIYCTNAINFIDGIDGQASSIAVVAMGYYAWVLNSCAPVYAVVCLCVVGALLAFMRFNVLGKASARTKTFMGDTGSLFLGLVMTFMGVLACNMCAEPLNEDNCFVMAFAPLFLPCLDVVRVVIHRVRFGNSPFMADKNHIHHKLLAIGLSHHKVSLVVSLLNILIIVVACVLAQYLDVNFVIAILLIVYTLLNVVLTKLMK